MNLKQQIVAGVFLCRVRRHCDGADHCGRELVQLPGRAVEDRRSGHQGPTRQDRRQLRAAPTPAARPEKQLADIDGLIAKGAKALIILAMDKDAIIPALAKAKAKNIPVVAYDRLIEQPGVFYITFDNKEVGRMQARAVLAAKPKGNYVMIKGSPTDPNADFLRAGQQEVLADAIKKGDIKIVGDEYTEGWKPEVAQKNMEQILTKNSNKVDAVVASNDGMAGGRGGGPVGAWPEGCAGIGPGR